MNQDQQQINTVLAALDALGDDAAVHIWPDDLDKCGRTECTAVVYSVRMGSPEGKTVPLFSREQVYAALTATRQAAPEYTHPVSILTKEVKPEHWEPQQAAPSQVMGGLPQLPEGKGVVRGPASAFNNPESGSLVDFDCEGPLSHCPEDGEELFTADQMRDYARTTLLEAFTEQEATFRSAVELSELIETLRQDAQMLKSGDAENILTYSDGVADNIEAAAAILEASAQQGEIVVTKTEAGQIVAVTRQDEEGRIIEVIAEASTQREQPAAMPPLKKDDIEFVLKNFSKRISDLQQEVESGCIGLKIGIEKLHGRLLPNAPSLNESEAFEQSKAPDRIIEQSAARKPERKRCESCRSTGAIHCSDPTNCGGPWTEPQAQAGEPFPFCRVEDVFDNDSILAQSGVKRGDLLITLQSYREAVAQDQRTILQLLASLKYLDGIAERGEGRVIRDDETTEQFVLGYVKKLEQAIAKKDAALKALIEAADDAKGFTGSRQIDAKLSTAITQGKSALQ